MPKHACPGAGNFARPMIAHTAIKACAWSHTQSNVRWSPTPGARADGDARRRSAPPVSPASIRSVNTSASPKNAPFVGRPWMKPLAKIPPYWTALPRKPHTTTLPRFPPILVSGGHDRLLVSPHVRAGVPTDHSPTLSQRAGRLHCPITGGCFLR